MAVRSKKAEENIKLSVEKIFFSTAAILLRVVAGGFGGSHVASSDLKGSRVASGVTCGLKGCRWPRGVWSSLGGHGRPCGFADGLSGCGCSPGVMGSYEGSQVASGCRS
jgi:hypothetical protein